MEYIIVFVIAAIVLFVIASNTKPTLKISVPTLYFAYGQLVSEWVEQQIADGDNHSARCNIKHLLGYWFRPLSILARELDKDNQEEGLALHGITYLEKELNRLYYKRFRLEPEDSEKIPLSTIITTSQILHRNKDLFTKLEHIIKTHTGIDIIKEPFIKIDVILEISNDIMEYIWEGNLEQVPYGEKLFNTCVDPFTIMETKGSK